VTPGIKDYKRFILIALSPGKERETLHSPRKTKSTTTKYLLKEYLLNMSSENSNDLKLSPTATETDDEGLGSALT